MQAPFYLAPGFKYEPTDEEICDYLQCKQIDCNHHNYPVQDYDVYGTEPWLLPVIGTEFNDGEGLSDHQYYIVKAKNRQRKAGNGHWKTTGKEKAIADGLKKVIGYTRALTYYSYPKPERKTNWIMHEYRLLKNADVQWTMCKIGETGRLDSDVSAVSVEHQQQEQDQLQQQQQQQQQQHQNLGLMGFEVLAQQDWNAYLPEVEIQNHHQQQQQQQQHLQQQQHQSLGSMDFEVQAHQDCNAYLLDFEKENHQQHQQQQQLQQQYQNLGLMDSEVQTQQDWNAYLLDFERQNNQQQQQQQQQLQQQPHQNLGSMEFEVQAQQDWNAYLLEVDKGTNDHGLGSEDLWQSAGLHSFQEYHQTPSNIWDDMDTMGEVFQATNLTFNF